MARAAAGTARAVTARFTYIAAVLHTVAWVVESRAALAERCNAAVARDVDDGAGDARRLIPML